MIKNNRILIFFILLGLAIRLLLSSLLGFKIDMDAWFAWAIRLNQMGFVNFYSDQIWTNYTPGYLYILGLLGFIKNLFHLNDSIFYFILKLPSVTAEIILSVLIYKQIAKKSLIWAKVAAGMVLLNPVFIFNSAIWGQIDGLLSLCLIGSIISLGQKKLILSSIFLGLGFLIKPQTIAVLPIFALFLVRNFSFKKLIQLSVPSSTIVLLLSLPFFLNQPILGFIRLFTKMVSDYPYTSLNAYNLWGIIGFWINDNTIWHNLSYQFWGYILLIIYWIILGYSYLKKRLSLFAVAAMATMAFFFFPTRVHERYLYPAIIFLILTAFYLKSKLLVLLTSILSLLHILNLYYVYIYYNQFYLKLPGVIYSPLIYNFLADNSKGLSLVSTIVFILISFSIIKHNDAVYKQT